MDLEEDDGFHSLDEEDKIFEEIKQEILDEESMYLKITYQLLIYFINYFFYIYLVKWISEHNIDYDKYLYNLQNNSVECPVCHTGNLIKSSVNTISCDTCHISIQTFFEIDDLKNNLENTALEHSRLCQAPVECIVFPTPYVNSMFMLCNICQFLFQVS